MFSQITSHFTLQFIPLKNESTKTMTFIKEKVLTNPEQKLSHDLQTCIRKMKYVRLKFQYLKDQLLQESLLKLKALT